jgi:hypothetical protein
MNFPSAARGGNGAFASREHRGPVASPLVVEPLTCLPRLSKNESLKRVRSDGGNGEELTTASIFARSRRDKTRLVRSPRVAKDQDGCERKMFAIF